MLDVVPYEVQGTPIIASNPSVPGGNPVLVRTRPWQIFTITVALADMSYSANYAYGKHLDPSKLIVGDPLPARIEGDKLILKGNDGKEVKALITRRARIADKN